jgi:molybdopterin-binding protein
VLQVENLSKDLGNFALHDVSFTVAKDDYFALLGASGVGKTVLLEMIAGLIRPDGGAVRLDGCALDGPGAGERPVAIVHQDQVLFPHMTVFANIAYGLHCRGVKGRAVSDRVAAVAATVGCERHLDRRPASLSGGEGQRVALARALATEPRCLLLDEPLSSVDAGSRTALRALLRSLHRGGLTMVHVTHDYEEAVSLATRVAVMEEGRVVQVGTPDDIFLHPKSEFVARFVGIRNFLRGTLRRPTGGAPDLAEFVTNGLAFAVATDAPGGPGFFTVRSEDITISTARLETSARNALCGPVVDIAAARLGIEVTVDVGVELAALVTPGSVRRLGLDVGRQVWLSFKATAGRFFEE